ncbi:hypothetical protein HanRHA438_Chr06g0249951 [Helianthus annuus]|nr:hypothetical protein HanRHA438_Chr06g0249951 [Helianthus annuus]
MHVHYRFRKTCRMLLGSIQENGHQEARELAKGHHRWCFSRFLKPNRVQSAVGHVDAEGDLAMDSDYTDSDTDSDDPPDSRLLSPQASDYETGNKTSANSPTSRVTFVTKKKREKTKPVKACANNQTGPASQKRGPFGHQMAKLQIPPSVAFFSAPDSSMSSPLEAQ